MTENILLAVLLIAVSYLDGRRDKTNSARYKWPYSGVQITTQGIRWAKDMPVRPTKDLFTGKVLKTIDQWHVVKWLAFYPPLIYIWWQLYPNLYLMGGVAVASMVAWKLHPRPSHWG